LVDPALALDLSEVPPSYPGLSVTAK
jgi:hypothetical protein